MLRASLIGRIAGTLLAVAASVCTVQLEGAKLSTGHGDIGIGYKGAAFNPHWHIGPGAIVDGLEQDSVAEYESSVLIVEVGSTHIAPIGLQGLIGIEDGTEVWVMGSAAHQPYIGFSAEELAPEDWTGDVMVTLSNWRTPSNGQFALYTTNHSGAAVVDAVFSTFDIAQTVLDNRFPLWPGAHFHFEFAFTKVGYYELSFTWQGVHTTDGLITATESFVFHVIPEPSTTGLIILAATAGIVLGRRRTAGSRKGFTLIEILIAVAVLGVLIALTIPVVSGVRHTAHRVQCASNQRQIGGALLLYATEHNGFLPQSSHSASPFSDKRNWMQALRDYIQDIDSVLICPAEPPERQELIKKHNATSYVLNDLVVEHPSHRNVHRIPVPADTILLFTIAEIRTPSISNDHIHGATWTSWQAVLNDIEPDRHRAGNPSAARTKGSANYLFADGRVENIHAAELKNIIESGHNPATVPTH